MLKANERLKLSQDVASNHVREKVKPQCKLSYKVFEEKYGYDTLLGISPFPTLIRVDRISWWYKTLCYSCW